MGYVTNTVNCSLVTNALVVYKAAGCTTNITHQGPGYPNALTLGWNEQYQLTNVQRSTSNVLHSAISYSYDLLGRRASRTQDGISEYYVYDGDHVAFDLDASRRLKRFYGYGPGIDNVLFMNKYSTGGSLLATYYYIKDQQNTVLALADSSGNIVESYDYDAWGRVLSVTDASGNELTSDLGLPISGLGNRYTFQGREIDWETGLTYFRARWYNPVSGRWLSKDPIGISGGLNQYVFCGNNPVNFVDPLGLAEASSTEEFEKRIEQVKSLRQKLVGNDSLPESFRSALQSCSLLISFADSKSDWAVYAPELNAIRINANHWTGGTSDTLLEKELARSLIHEGLHAEGQLDHPESGHAGTPFESEVLNLLATSGY